MFNIIKLFFKIALKYIQLTIYTAYKVILDRTSRMSLKPNYTFSIASIEKGEHVLEDRIILQEASTGKALQSMTILELFESEELLYLLPPEEIKHITMLASYIKFDRNRYQLASDQISDFQENVVLVCKEEKDAIQIDLDDLMNNIELIEHLEPKTAFELGSRTALQNMKKQKVYH